MILLYCVGLNVNLSNEFEVYIEMWLYLDGILVFSTEILHNEKCLPLISANYVRRKNAV